MPTIDRFTPSVCSYSYDGKYERTAANRICLHGLYQQATLGEADSHYITRAHAGWQHEFICPFVRLVALTRHATQAIAMTTAS
jgi:hypothetical protein